MARLFPRRHGDFAQRYDDPEEEGEEAMAEAAENSYTPPVLAVMLILSKGGGVQTLFPSLDRKFTQSMGMQPIDSSGGTTSAGTSAGHWRTAAGRVTRCR